MNAVGEWWIALGQRMSLNSVIFSGINDECCRWMMSCNGAKNESQ